MEEAITQLQIIVGHQEVEIASLSAELYAQQKELARLKQELAHLGGRVQAMQDEGANAGAPEPPPPHY